eukprot:366433-Chlamydomonas_euryale.AAC.13
MRAWRVAFLRLHARRAGGEGPTLHLNRKHLSAARRAARFSFLRAAGGGGGARQRRGALGCGI